MRASAKERTREWPRGRDQRVSGLVVYRFDATPIFANVEVLTEEIDQVIADAYYPEMDDRVRAFIGRTLGSDPPFDP